MGNERGYEGSSPIGSGETVPLEDIPLHSANLLTVVEEDGTIRYESPSIERVLGFDPEEVVGEQVANYCHPNDRERVLEKFAAVISGEEGGVQSVEYRHEQADGTYRWVESVASTTPMPDGRYVVNTRDISERKERERTLERTNDRLNEFASAVSHDLRSPLQVAKVRVDQAMKTGDGEHLDAVVQAHERMESIIETFLTLARAGKRIDEMSSVDLTALGERCWQTVATGDATLVIETDRSIRADRSRMRQLLENLVRNAVEHGSTSPPSQAQEDSVEHRFTGNRSKTGDAVEYGGGDVTITIGELAEKAGFYVEDDGDGIEEGKREHVLESGYSTKETGTGLGLAIVAEIAEAHGWDVTVTESDDGGTRVEISGVEFS